MAAELSPDRQSVLKVLDSKEPLVNAELIHLSRLGGEEVEFLERAWVKASTERRQQIVFQLIHLSETDLKLDFSSTFLFCLQDPDEVVRAQAVAGLEAEENHLLIAPLIQSLKEDSSAKVRAAAAIALGRFAMLGELGKLSNHYSNKVYKALLDVSESETELLEVKRRALEAIAPFNLPRVKKLIEEAYHSGDVRFKTSAIYAMGRNCDSLWLTTLLTEINSDEVEIRYEAAGACGELGASEAVPYLIGLLEDEDAQVQEAAINALGEIGGEEARCALNNLVSNPQPRISQAAKSALEELDFSECPLFLEL